VLLSQASADNVLSWSRTWMLSTFCLAGWEACPTGWIRQCKQQSGGTSEPPLSLARVLMSGLGPGCSLTRGWTVKLSVLCIWGLQAVRFVLRTAKHQHIIHKNM